jgi:hypothetical protein
VAVLPSIVEHAPKNKARKDSKGKLHGDRSAD